METSVKDFDQILIQDDNLFKLHPLVTESDMQLLVSTRSNRCTKQLRVHFKEIIQIESNKLDKMRQLTRLMKPHIDPTSTESSPNDDLLPKQIPKNLAREDTRLPFPLKELVVTK